MTRAVRAGMDFVSALDRGSLRGIAALCAPDATWWVDGGPGREVAYTKGLDLRPAARADLSEVTFWNGPHEPAS